MAIENLVFPGRFQPMTLGHVDVVKKICHDFDPRKIVLAFPKNIERTMENPFLSDETRKIIELSTEKLFPVDTIGIEIEGNLQKMWIRYIRDNRIDLVVSGNPDMVNVINGIGQTTTRAMCINDGSVSQIRASDVRGRMRIGDMSWRNLMVSEAVNYAESLKINWAELPIRRKRWYESETRVGVEPTYTVLQTAV